LEWGDYEGHFKEIRILQGVAEARGVFSDFVQD
jgi:hypothetical protein